MLSGVFLFLLLGAGLALHQRAGFLPRAYRQTHWPGAARLVHGGLIAAIPLLWLGGIALFWPPWHGVMLPLFPLLYWSHVILGASVFLVAATMARKLMAGPHPLRTVDWTVTGGLLTAVTVSGVVLWLPGAPAARQGAAFAWHGDLSYGLLVWLLMHALGRALSPRSAHGPLNHRFQPARRHFVGGLGAFIALSLLPFVWPRGRPALRPSATGRVPAFPAYYTYTGTIPAIDGQRYGLTVDGLVNRPLALGLAELYALPGYAVVEDFHCITGWTVPDVPWRGVRIETLMARCAPRPEANYVVFHSADGVYVESLSLDQALAPGVLLATHIADQPLLRKGGYPLRLIVPQMYGYKSIKWVERIEFTDERPIGTWELSGYPTDAWIRKSPL